MNLRSVSVVPYHRAAESDFPALSRLIADAMGGSGGRNEPNRTQGGLSVNEQVRSFRHWVYVAIRALQNPISRVPLRVYDITDPANPVEVADENDPLVNLLRYPNPWDTDIEFLSRIVGQVSPQNEQVSEPTTAVGIAATLGPQPRDPCVYGWFVELLGSASLQIRPG